MRQPEITIYGRVLDNITKEEVTGFNYCDPNFTWNYGRISAITGGESEYIVEFDIWNNEPRHNGLMYNIVYPNAINCSFSAWNDIGKTSSTNITYLSNTLTYARCVTNDYDNSFYPVAGVRDLKDLYGSIQPQKKGTLYGQMGGDHFVVQTKIIVPQKKGNEQISSGLKNFVYTFYYEWE